MFLKNLKFSRKRGTFFQESVFSFIPLTLFNNYEYALGPNSPLSKCMYVCVCVRAKISNIINGFINSAFYRNSYKIDMKPAKKKLNIHLSISTQKAFFFLCERLLDMINNNSRTGFFFDEAKGKFFL
jgi:hypothetical protein